MSPRQPMNPDTVVAAARSPGDGHRPAGGARTLYRRVGGGGWREATAGLPPTAGRWLPVLAADRCAPGVSSAARGRGLFRSDGGGEAWTIALAV